MNAKELVEKVRGYTAKATLGPWDSVWADQDYGTVCVAKSDGTYPDYNENDAIFCANIRTDAEALLGLVEQQARQLEAKDKHLQIDQEINGDLMKQIREQAEEIEWLKERNAELEDAIKKAMIGMLDELKKELIK